MIESNSPIYNIETEEIKDIYKYELSKKRHRNLMSNSKYKEDDFKESLYFQDKYDKVLDRVISIMREHPETRNFDWQLVLFYWAKMGMIKIIVPMDQLNKITPIESITRQKRKAIEKAKNGDENLKWLLKDKDNLEIREDHENKYHDYYQSKNNSNKAELIK
jgi:hypothetical protein